MSPGLRPLLGPSTLPPSADLLLEAVRFKMLENELAERPANVLLALWAVDAVLFVVLIAFKLA